MEESLELLANIERLILTATFVPRAAILHTYIIYRLHRCNIIAHEYAHAVEVQLILMNVSECPRRLARASRHLEFFNNAFMRG